VKHLVICSAGATASARTWYRQEIRRSELWWKGRLENQMNVSQVWWKEKTDHWWREYSVAEARAARFQAQFEETNRRLGALRNTMAKRESVRYLAPQLVRRIVSQALSLVRGKR
jgi:hypothetical protein